MLGQNTELTCTQGELDGGRTSNRSSPRGSRVPLSDRSFECTHPGCNKRFTRAEHLQRHALNHQPGGDACPKCHAHFKRPDLLKRHMDRHRQKDIEAGGPGYGVLDTRKRSWKAPDGSVVEKRPCVRLRPETQQIPSPESEPSENPDHHVPDPGRWAQGDQSWWELDWQQSAVFGLEGQNRVSLSLDSACQAKYGFQVTLGQQNDHMGTDVCWADSTNSNLDPNLLNENEMMPDVAHLDYDQLFQPDTASSFNMPYTTALDYSWLFDLKGNPTSLISPPEEQSQLDQASNYPGHLHIMPPESVDNSQFWPGPSDSPHSASVSDDLNMQQLAVQPTNRPTRRASSDTAKANKKAGGRARSSAPVKPNELGNRSSSTETDRPFSMLSKNPAIPQIDEQIRKRLLQLVEATNLSLPDPRSLWDEPLLSVKALQEYLHLYFTRFNTAYPLIHLPTFDTNNVEPLLLLSLVLLGATYSSSEAHQLAICIHDVMRPSIFAHVGFSPQPELWTLQTILLVECFGKSRAGQKQHDMSHLFHGLLINLIRRSDCQSVRPVGPPSGSANHENILQSAWRRWSIAEQKKRLALLCFMWDTQHAVLFCQSLCMSAFELRVELPCSQKIWEAEDAASWASAWRSTPPQAQFYLPALKSYINSSVSLPQGLSGLSRVLILHGLMSIAWDMQRRDQTALGVVSVDGSGGNWRKIIGSAYCAWKSDFDSYTLAMIGRPPRSTEDEARRSEHVAFTTAYNALYHSAQALLNMEFLDLQIYAGARNILGRPVQQKDYRRSARNVKQWISPKRETQDESQSQAAKDAVMNQVEQPMTLGRNAANIAAWHAGRMLRDGTKILTTSDVAMGLFHVPWCLYLATLTCWAFHHASPAPRRNNTSNGDVEEEDSDDSDEMVWNPRAEMEALVSNMAEMGQRGVTSCASQRWRTNGLVWTMAEILSKVRWEIVQNGVVVLRGLVPRRLINQYDDPPGDGFA